MITFTGLIVEEFNERHSKQQDLNPTLRMPDSFGPDDTYGEPVLMTEHPFHFSPAELREMYKDKDKLIIIDSIV